MKTPAFLSSLHVVAAAICLGVAWPASGAPAKSREPKAESSPAAPVAPEAKVRPFPFKNTVISVDKPARTFSMGKKNVHRVHVLPETRLSKGDETPATFDEIIVGMEVRGSVRKRADGDYEAVSVKMGPKAQASPSPVAASPTPKAPRKR